MSMKLWLWYVPGTEAQIAEACQAAEQELQARDIAIGAAFAATVAANELEDSVTAAAWSESPAAGGGAPSPALVDGPALAAWYAAEFAAFQKLSDLTGEWPSQGSLIVVEG